MSTITKRNLKLYFRDRSAVFFSFLSVFIVIGLYVLFLGDVWTDSLQQLKDADQLMNTWLMAGLLGVASVTTTMGAFGIMVEDRAKKIFKDFYSSAISRSTMVAGYIISSFLIGLLMSLVTLAGAEIYLVSQGISLLTPIEFLKILGVLVLASLSNSSFILFLISFINSEKAFSTASTIVGTLIGFITGIYLPVGTLPESVQYIVKCFPASHSVSLLRQIFMDAQMKESLEGFPAAFAADFKTEMGIVYQLGDQQISVWISILFIVASTVLFFGLSVLNLSRKKK